MTGEVIIDRIWYSAMRACIALWEVEGPEDEVRAARDVADGVLLLIGLIDGAGGPPESIEALTLRGRNVLESQARAALAGL